MRLSWARALPRSLWGRPGAAELCRRLWQRPARVPSEGGDTARGDTSKGDTPRDDTLKGDTSKGGTLRDDTSRGDTFRGATFEGDTTKGDTLKDDTFRGDTFRGDTSRGDTLGGDTFRGDTFRDDTFRGDTFKGDTFKGDTFSGATPAGAPSPGTTSKPPWRRLRRLRPHRDPGEDRDNSDTTGDSGDSTGDSGDSTGDSGGPAAFSAALRDALRLPAGRGGRLALVEAALAAMPALGVERSLGAYNALLRLLPRGPWVPRGPLQRLLFPFPRQQECGLRLLEQMERYGVVPDAETRFLLLGVFGPRSRPVRKVQRMLFWLPRFRQLDPHPLPPRLPPPGLAAARLGLRRIAADPGAAITVVQRPVPDTGEDEGSVQPFILSSQSPEQRELLARHGPARPVFVEGPFPLWLRGTRLSYFVLRGDPLPPHLRDPPPDPERSFYFPLSLELELERGPWDDDDFDVDEVEEGPVFALCMAGSGDRRTLARWISALQQQNPALGTAPVVFRLSGGPGETPGDPPGLGRGSPPLPGLEPPEG